MALLHAHDPPQDIPLPGNCLIGRGPSSTLQIADRRVSGEHARITWDGQRWSVRDLGSTNGTWVADRQLRPGETVPVHQGSRLAFGSLERVFSLEDAGPPSPIARCQADGVLRAADDGVLALPDEAAPGVLVFEDSVGRWVMEQDGVSAVISSGAVVQTGGQSWVLHLPTAVEPTLDARRDGLELSEVTLRFQVSDDEERVGLIIEHPGGQEVIPPRAHLYTLLTLARIRAEDPDQSAGQSGWVYAESLHRMLAIDEMRVNVEVYRCRRDLGRLGIRGAAGVIERHRGTRQIRCGTSRLAFERL